MPDSDKLAERIMLERIDPNIRQIGIGVPSGDMLHTNFAMAMAAMCFYNGLMKMPIAIMNQKGGHIADARNRMVEHAQKINCEWLLMLDSDLTFPPQTLARLLSHDKPVVGCTYARRSQPHDNLAVPLGQQPVQNASGLTAVDRLPTGCLLLRLDIFKKMKRPYFRFEHVEEDVEKGIKPKTGAEDYYFCDAVRRAGETVWLDVELSFALTHWGEVGWQLTETTDKDEPRFRVVELSPAHMD